MRVKALVPMYYDRRMLAVGEIYDMDPREEAAAILLEKLGKIVRLSEEAPPPRQPESIHVEQTTTIETSTLPPDTGKRTYRRRDMRAER